MDFNINLDGIAKMFEVLAKHKTARVSFYILLFVAVLISALWAVFPNLADIIKAIAEIK